MQRELIKRIAFATIIVAAIIFLYAEIFLWSMLFFENQDVTFAQSLQVVVESLTTSGYGGFAPWESNFLNYFVLIMNLTGVVLIFVAFPVFFLPFLKDAIQKSPPVKVNKTDHVIICSSSTHAEVLIKEFLSRNQDYVIIESDEGTAKDHLLAGFEVMKGNPESESTLQAACLKDAKAVVLNSTTDINISILFSIRNLNKSVKTIAILEDEDMETYHKLAGADIAISPRQLIGKSLAIQVPAISINDSVEIDNTVDLIEIDIEEGSDLCDKCISEDHLLDKYHINIIGAWKNGEFESPVSSDMILNSYHRTSQ